MRYFSYNDYMDYTENGEINKLKKVEENNEKYEIKNIEKYNLIVKKLEQKENLIKFLQKYLNFYETQEIEDIKYLEGDKNMIICKIRKKGMYIFIKITEIIDHNISFEMLEKSIDIIKYWDKNKRQEKEIYPIVIPVVIYIGKEKWTESKNKIKKVKYIEFKENQINFTYNLISIKL